MEAFFASGIHWKLFNFIAFIGVLYFILRKPVKDFWASRSHEIRFEMEDADRLLQESQKNYKRLETRLARIEREVKDLIESLIEAGELEKRTVIEEAQRFAEKVARESERMMNQEVQKAKELLKMQAVQFSVELAEKLIREKFRSEDQEKLVGKYLMGLEGNQAW